MLTPEPPLERKKEKERKKEEWSIRSNNRVSNADTIISNNLSHVSAGPRDLTAVTALAACNKSMQTASLQCFSVILKSCNFVTLGQITQLKKIIEHE